MNVNTKAIDFLSQGMVKSYFRERPVLIRLEEPELAGLMGVKVRETPSKGGSLTVLNFIFPIFCK
jgi:hypothetical protein